MIEAELTQFVRESLLKGVSRPDIQRQLVDAGWSGEKASKALTQFAEVDSVVPVPRPKPYLSAREAFMYLLVFATLYISAFNVGNLLFDLIDWAVPDAIANDLAWRRSIRWSLASILIAFPAFLLLSRWLRANLMKDPAKRGSKVRKWLTYLTLFVAAATIMGDLITLVFYFLGGELTTRFLLKVAVVGVSAGSVFGYYLWDLRGEEADVGVRRAEPKPSPLHASFVWLVIVGVSLTVVGGIWAAGSPGEARTYSLDLQRVNDLQKITAAIDSFWGRNERLPVSLPELESERKTWLHSIYDPTQRIYEYRTTGGRDYELCAVFDAASEDTAESNVLHPRFWQHGAGRVCFEVEVEVE